MVASLFWGKLLRYELHNPHFRLQLVTNPGSNWLSGNLKENSSISKLRSVCGQVELESRVSSPAGIMNDGSFDSRKGLLLHWSPQEPGYPLRHGSLWGSIFVRPCLYPPLRGGLYGFFHSTCMFGPTWEEFPEGSRHEEEVVDCYTPQGVYPASLTPSTVSVCQDRKIWRSFMRNHSGRPSGANDE